MLETILPIVPESEQMTALALVLDRLCTPRGGRFLFFDPAPYTMPFAIDFLEKALKRFSLQQVASAVSGSGRHAVISGRLGGDLLARAIEWSRLCNATIGKEPVTFRFASGELGTDLLLPRWSSPEEWGTWSDGASAGLRLGVVPESGQWKAILTFRTFGAEQKISTIRVRRDVEPEAVEWHAVANQISRQEITFEGNSQETTLHFSFPDAQSPFELGVSEDRRKLGVGLIALELLRVR